MREWLVYRDRISRFERIVGFITSGTLLAGAIYGVPRIIINAPKMFDGWWGGVFTVAILLFVLLLALLALFGAHHAVFSPDVAWRLGIREIQVARRSPVKFSRTRYGPTSVRTFEVEEAADDGVVTGYRIVVALMDGTRIRTHEIRSHEVADELRVAMTALMAPRPAPALLPR